MTEIQMLELEGILSEIKDTTVRIRKDEVLYVHSLEEASTKLNTILESIQKVNCLLFFSKN
ncbi:MAG: hypothetical protein AB8B61_00570 [Cyclobacteriaceae bacterium]